MVIVAWNVRDLTLACLRSLYEDAGRSNLLVDVWVVDNASADGTAEAIRSFYPQTHVLEPGENLGFARGNNLALNALGLPNSSSFPPYVLLLNPDTAIRPGALRALLEAALATGAGLIGARLVYGDGGFQHSAFAFPGLAQLVIDLFPMPWRVRESRLNGRYPRRLYVSGKPFKVDHPLGAAFMVRRETIAQTGMFDEQFRLYCEEIDWAMRIHSAGWDAICVPTAEIVHYAGSSTSQVRPQSIIGLWTARLILFRKHYGPIKRLMAKVIIRAGMNRLIQAAARDSSQPDEVNKALVDAYREVIRRIHSL